MKSLLIPLMYVCLQTWLGTAQAQTLVTLDMRHDAFDDQYIGCEEKMYSEAHNLLMQEKSKSPLLSTVWENAAQKWKEIKAKSSFSKIFKDEYGIAIVAYTDNTRHSSGVFSTEFNKAVRENGKSRAYYMNNFPFKAFHYYLTRAVQLFRVKCHALYKIKVYRGVEGVTFQHTGSSPIRFGQFTSSSLNKIVAETFGKDTVFTIHTCFGVPIWTLSYNPEQEEVLIPVHEKFHVSSDGSNRFILRSTNQTCSHFNCAYLGGEKNETCLDNSATRGGVAFPGGMSPSLFGGSVILIHAAALKLMSGF